MSKKIKFLLPIDGKPIPLSDVNDYLFNKKIMGEGAAVRPVSNFIYAPVDGEIAVIYEAKHAIILKSTDGLQVLIHVGIDAAKLEGRGFAAYVKVGDKVKAGDKILFFDREFVEKNASDVTPLVITNPEIVESIDVHFDARKALDNLMDIVLK